MKLIELKAPPQSRTSASNQPLNPFRLLHSQAGLFPSRKKMEETQAITTLRNAMDLLNADLYSERIKAESAIDGTFLSLKSVKSAALKGRSRDLKEASAELAAARNLVVPELLKILDSTNDYSRQCLMVRLLHAAGDRRALKPLERLLQNETRRGAEHGDLAQFAQSAIEAIKECVKEQL